MVTHQKYMQGHLFMFDMALQVPRYYATVDQNSLSKQYQKTRDKTLHQFNKQGRITGRVIGDPN